MIVIRVELHSAITCKVTEIARMHISNVGGSRQTGHYFARTYRGRSSEQLSRGDVQRRASVKGYPRLRLHVWHLVARALIAMKYVGAAEREQPTQLFDVINGAIPGEHTMKDSFERRRIVQHQFLGRISIVQSDPEGFKNYQNLIQEGYRPRVFVDGVEHREFVTADPDAGLVRTAGHGPGLRSMVELKGSVSIRLERSARP